MKEINESLREAHIICLAELDPEGDRKKRLTKGEWGTWKIIKNKKYLGTNRPFSYTWKVKISEIKRLGPLHWLAHIREKTWLKRGDLEDLISAFNDICGYQWIWKAWNKTRAKG